MSLENLLWSVTEAIFRHNDPYQPDFPQERLFQVVERLFRRHMTQAEGAPRASTAVRQLLPPSPLPRLESCGGYMCSLPPGPRPRQLRLTPHCVEDGFGCFSDIDEYKEGRQAVVTLNAPMKLTRLPVPGSMRPTRVRRLNPPPICLRLVHSSEAAG